MKKAILCLLLLTTLGFDSQRESAFGVGEWFKFRIHYGFVNAGYATLEVKEAILHNEKVYHLIGKGQTTGISRFFFKVDDLYESYIDEKTFVPYQFLRKINEGGYTKYQEGFFIPHQNKITVKDYKHKTEKTFAIPKNTQDILSAFYYLRNFATIDEIKPGEYVAIDMFFDEETTKFKLKFIGRENIKTKFGTVASMIFKPYVFSGRVFKEQESVTVWISDDDNKIPLRIQADLLVGSIKADLESYKGVRFPLKKRT
jgi:hypothetical protein